MKAWLRLDQTKNPPEGNTLEIEGEIYLEISLTEYMVGFAEWCANNYIKQPGGNWSKHRSSIRFTTEELLEIYLKEKNIIWK